MHVWHCNQMKLWLLKLGLKLGLKNKTQPRRHSDMTARRFVAKHNHRINLSPMQPETEYYHPVFAFLRHSRVNHVLTNSPVLFLDYIEQFWNTAVYDSTVVPPVIRARVNNVVFQFSADDLRQILRLGTVDQENGPTSFSQALRVRAFRRMGYVGNVAKDTFFKSELYGHWRYLSHVILVALSNKKSGWDTLNIQTQSQVIALVYNKPYNFSQFFFNMMKNQISVVDKERFLLYPRFVMMIVNFRVPNLPAAGEFVEVAGLEKRLYKDCISFRAKKPQERRAPAIPLFGALVNPAYQTSSDDGWKDVIPVVQPEGEAGGVAGGVAGGEAGVVGVPGAGAGQAQVPPQPQQEQAQQQAQQQQQQQQHLQAQQVEPEVEVINDVLDQVANPQVGATLIQPEVAEELLQGILHQEHEKDDFEQIENYDARADLDAIGSKVVLKEAVGSSSKKRKEVDEDEDCVPEEDVPLKRTRRARRVVGGETGTSSVVSGSGIATILVPDIPLPDIPTQPQVQTFSAPGSSSVPTQMVLPDNMIIADMESQIRALKSRLASTEDQLKAQESRHAREMEEMTCRIELLSKSFQEARQGQVMAKITAMKLSYDNQISQLTQRLEEQQRANAFLGQFERQFGDLPREVEVMNHYFLNQLKGAGVVAKEVSRVLKSQSDAIHGLEDYAEKQKRAILSNHLSITEHDELIKRLVQELASRGEVTQTCKDDILRGLRDDDRDDDPFTPKEGEMSSSLVILGFVAASTSNGGV